MWLYHRAMSPNDADGMANSVDPDQTAPLGAVWSGSALFAQTCLSKNLGSLRYTLDTRCPNLPSQVSHVCKHFQNSVKLKNIICSSSAQPDSLMRNMKKWSGLCFLCKGKILKAYLIQRFPQGFFLYGTLPKNNESHNYMCHSCMHDGRSQF